MRFRNNYVKLISTAILMLCSGTLCNYVSAYQSPIDSSTISFAWSQVGQAGGHFTFTLKDPATKESLTGRSDTVMGSPYAYPIMAKNGLVAFNAKYTINDPSNPYVYTDRNMMGYSIYDPCKGMWVTVSNHYYSGQYYMNVGDEGVGYYTITYSNPVSAGTRTESVARMVIYEPDQGIWKILDISMGNCYGGIGMIQQGGVVGWQYTNDPMLNGGATGFAIYDPIRQEWKQHQVTTSRRIDGYIKDRTIYFNSSSDYYGYDFVSGQWKQGIKTGSCASFRVGLSYNTTLAPRTIWVTDMSAGAASTSFNWGDGYISSQGGFHAYSTERYVNIKQTITSASGFIDTTTINAASCAVNLIIKNRTYNVLNRGAEKAMETITTEDKVILNSGADVIFNAGQQIRLKPGFKASQGSKFQTLISQ